MPAISIVKINRTEWEKEQSVSIKFWDRELRGSGPKERKRVADGAGMLGTERASLVASEMLLNQYDPEPPAAAADPMQVGAWWMYFESLPPGDTTSQIIRHSL